MFSLSKGVSPLLFVALLSPAAQAELSLEMALELANNHDPRIRGSELMEQAIEQNKLAIDKLPDPVMSMSLSNLPVNGFDLNQEAMTQVKVGISQRFPRGDSIRANQQHLALRAGQHPHKRAQQKAQNRLQISQLWLSSQGMAKKVAVLNQYKQLFTQLSAIVEASYAVAQSHTRQQDVLRSQLEVSRIENQIEELKIRGQTAFHQMLAWFPQAQQLQYQAAHHWQALQHSAYPQLPEAPMVTSTLQLMDILNTHPAVQAMASSIQADFSLIDVARQEFAPQWGINASYGLRDDQPNGQSRADLFSVGVTFDLPIFSESQNAAKVKSAKLAAQAKETERRLLLQNMQADSNRLAHQLTAQKRRLADYQGMILTPMHQQSEASLTAYTNGEGDFAEVMRSRLAELAAELEHIDLQIALLLTQAQLNYYLSPFAHGFNTAQTHNDFGAVK